MSTSARSYYRQILVAARGWLAKHGVDGGFIRAEASAAFRQNSSLTDEAEIAKKLFEAESRLALGVHYGLATPRPFYTAPGVNLRAQQNSGVRRAGSGRKKTQRSAPRKPQVSLAEWSGYISTHTPKKAD